MDNEVHDKAEKGESGTIVRGTSIVGVYTLVSRFLGFVRDLLVARYFGAGVLADTFFVAFRIPNLLRSFVAEGALSAAFVPLFTESAAQGKEAARAMMRSVLSCVLLFNLFLALAIWLFAPAVVTAIAPGFAESAPQLALCVTLTRIMIFYIVFVSIVALVNGALNTFKVFGASAMAQVVMNLALIAGALIAGRYSPEVGIEILAWSVIVGGMVQLAAQLPALRRAGLLVWPTLRIMRGPITQLAALMGPALIGAAVYQLSIFFATIFASLLKTGSVSWLFYADRVTQFPIGVFTIALASVLLPSLARASTERDSQGFSGQLQNSLRYTSFFMIPMSAFIVLEAPTITSLLFERGAFTRYDATMTSQAVTMLAFALWPVSCHSMMVRAFMARKDTVTPTLVGLISMAVVVTMSVVLMGPVEREVQSDLARITIGAQQSLETVVPLGNYGHLGLAFASVMGSLTSLLLTALLLRRHVGSLGWESFRATAQATIAAVFAYVLLQGLLFSGTGVLHLIVAIAVFAGLYVGVLVALKNREIQETFSLIFRLLKRAE